MFPFLAFLLLDLEGRKSLKIQYFSPLTATKIKRVFFFGRPASQSVVSKISKRSCSPYFFTRWLRGLLAFLPAFDPTRSFSKRDDRQRFRIFFLSFCLLQPWKRSKNTRRLGFVCPNCSVEKTGRKTSCSPPFTQCPEKCGSAERNYSTTVLFFFIP